MLPAPAAQPRARAADRGEASDRASQSRKQFKEVVNLREQEQIARQVTSRTTGRPMPVQQRSFTPPRRKRRDAAPAKAPAPAVAKAAKKVVRVEGEISVAELAKQGLCLRPDSRLCSSYIYGNLDKSWDVGRVVYECAVMHWLFSYTLYAQKCSEAHIYLSTILESGKSAHELVKHNVQPNIKLPNSITKI